MDEKETVPCPLCNQPLAGAHARKQRPGSLGKAVAEVIQDIGIWAEGDVVADDGHLLNADDLARYLANELAPILMKMYMRELRRNRAEHEQLKKRLASEREIVDDVLAGRKPKKSLKGRHALPPTPTPSKAGPGRPQKETCLRGHARIAANLNNSGGCRTCIRDRQKTPFQKTDVPEGQG